MERIKRWIPRLAVAATVALPTLAFPIGGDINFAFSEIQRGMGGATVALPQDAVIPSVNPAGISYLNKRIDGGVEFVFPIDAGYDATTPITPVSVAPGNNTIGNSAFYLPDVGIVVPLNAHDTFDASLYAFAGFGVSYGVKDDALVAPGGTPTFSPGAFGDGRFTADQKTVMGNLSIAHRFWHDTTSIGAGLLIAGQMFELRGANQFAQSSIGGPTANLNRGTDFDYGVGMIMGFMTSPNKYFSLGMAYQPIIHMSPLRLYRNVIVDGGRLDIPPVGTIGFALHPTDTVSLEFDVQGIWYRSTPNWSNDLNGIVNGTCAAGDISTCFGGTRGPAFAWGNQLNYKMGVQWQANDKWTLRAGWNRANRLTPEQAVVTGIIQLGGIVTDIVTIGGTHTFNKHNRLNFAFGYIPQKNFAGPNAISVNETQRINLRATGAMFAIGWSYLFK